MVHALAAPFSETSVIPNWVSPVGVRSLNQLERSLPPNAIVSAWYPIVAHVDHRPQIYMWPNPFAQSYWGFEKHSGQPLPAAQHVQFLLLPMQLSSFDYPGLFKKIEPDFTLIHHGGGFGLFERIPVKSTRALSTSTLARLTHQ